jgi:hypothetical protein
MRNMCLIRVRRSNLHHMSSAARPQRPPVIAAAAPSPSPSQQHQATLVLEAAEARRLRGALVDAQADAAVLRDERDALRQQVAVLTQQLFAVRATQAPNVNGVPSGGKSVAVVDAATDEISYITVH